MAFVPRSNTGGPGQRKTNRRPLVAPRPNPTTSDRLEPTATKSRACEPGDDRRTAAHDVPEETGPVILDHQHDRPLINAEVVRRHPPPCRAVRYLERLIKRRAEPVFCRHAKVHSREPLHGGDDYFGGERQ